MLFGTSPWLARMPSAMAAGPCLPPSTWLQALAFRSRSRPLPPAAAACPSSHLHSMLYFLEDDPDYNLLERMTADVRNTLAQHRDLFEVRSARAGCWCRLRRPPAAAAQQQSGSCP